MFPLMIHAGRSLQKKITEPLRLRVHFSAISLPLYIPHESAKKAFYCFNVVRLDVFHQYQKRKVYMNLSSILWQHLISTSLIITNIMYIQLFVSSRNVLKADMVWQGLKTDLSLNLIWYVFPYWFDISQT